MNLFTDKLTAEDRARALYYYFGWQGGTIHQLAKATGCSADILLSAPFTKTDGGFSAVRTCDCDWRVNVLAPRHKGDWPYWSSVICGFWVTGPLDKQTAFESLSLGRAK
jgi:hypothetical protein